MTGESDRFAELLQRAGLEIVGDRRTEEVLPPRAAWRPVIAFEAEPAETVRLDRPGRVAELNTQWHRLAVKEGVIGEDGVFLIDVAGNGTGGARRGWTRVRLTGQWNLAGVLGERPGQPEFITISTECQGAGPVAVVAEELHGHTLSHQVPRRLVLAIARAASGMCGSPLPARAGCVRSHGAPHTAPNAQLPPRTRQSGPRLSTSLCCRCWGS
ncbi:hypothetical protein [Streptomyces sp. NPDC048637]|uniref:hypothetical protein n=1 Tax=Streptomyces sp. NPDC048637 TaxID=3155636 RepID=UPI003419D5B6